MIALQNVRVRGFSRAFLDVYWEVVPTMEDIQEYQFYVERSEAEAGPWTVLAGPLVDRYYLRDTSTPQFTHNRTLFYRVRVRHQASGREFYSPIVDRAGDQDLIAAEVVRLEALLFQEFSGTAAWLFPQRTFGQRCPQCWDDVMNKRIDDSCPTCFGTGFSGGYHYPVRIALNIDEVERVEHADTFDHRQDRMFSARCSPSPDVKPMDLIIDHQNRRMRVLTSGGPTKFGVRLRQELRAVLLQPGCIEDAIELKVDTADLNVAAWRNYTNPQNPEAAGVIPDDALSGLFGRFGFT